jgi:hypothetical protein
MIRRIVLAGQRQRHLKKLSLSNAEGEDEAAQRLGEMRPQNFACALALVARYGPVCLESGGASFRRPKKCAADARAISLLMSQSRTGQTAAAALARRRRISPQAMSVDGICSPSALFGFRVIASKRQ